MPDKSSIYWMARALADEKRANRIAGRAADEIKSMYRRQYLKIVKQITALKAELDAGAELTRTQLWNYGRWRQLEAQLQAFVNEATRMQTETIHTALEEVFESTIGSAAKSFDETRMVLPVDPESVINTSWSGQNYSARVWHNQAAIADRMKHNMEDMFIQGKNLRDMKKALMKEFDVAFNDADRLVRTEAAYVLNRANITRYKNAGLAKVRWSTGPEDGDECVICAARSNKVYLIVDAPMIPAHPRCRCVYAGVVEIAGENVPVDGPDADRALEAAKAAKKIATQNRNSHVALKTAAKSGIINTKKTFNIPPPMNSEKYAKIKEGMAKRGVNIVSATGDDLAFLEYMDAEAAALGTNVILHRRKVPSASALFEEIIHNTQNRKRGEAAGGDFVERARREVEANRKLLRHAKAYGFTAEDISGIKHNLELWERDYKERTGREYEEI